MNSSTASSGPADCGAVTRQALSLIEARFPGVPSSGGRPDRAHVRIAAQQLPGVLALLRHHPAMAFDQLTALTAVDLSGLAAEHPFDLIYQLRSGVTGQRLQVTAGVEEPAAPLPAASEHWPGSPWLEREVQEMFGLRFAGPGRSQRLLTPPWLAAHPLLKSYPLSGRGEREAARQRGAVEPEAPAEGSVLDLPGAIGPDAPPLRIRLRLNDERVEEAGVAPGLAHCGYEKLAETLSYHQQPVAAERVSCADPTAGALAVILAVEALLQVEAPPRAAAIRRALAELSRLRSHLRWVARLARTAGYGQAAQVAATQAEGAAELHQALTSRRRMAGTLRVGGVSDDLPEGGAAAASAFVAGLGGALRHLRALWTDARSWARRAGGLGAMAGEWAATRGVTGPDLRACGVDGDLRRELPYSGYDHVDLDVPTASGGDVRDRCNLRLLEVQHSAGLLAAACNNLPAGPIVVDDYKTSPPPRTGAWTHIEELIHHMGLWMDGHGLRPPAGAQVYRPVEAATGELGVFLLSDGTDRPYRLHLRSPSLHQAQILPHLLRGASLEDVPVIVASFGIDSAEMDR